MGLNYTPPAVVRQGIEAVEKDLFLSPKTILDPAAGSGVFGQELARRWPNASIYGTEKRKEELFNLRLTYSSARCSDFRVPQPSGWPATYDLVMTNPHFPLWREYVEYFCGGMLGSNGVLVLLGYVSWGQRSRKGADIFDKYPPTACFRIRGTVSFDGTPGADMRDYCWWAWSPFGRDTGRTSYATTDLPRLSAADRTWRGTPPGRGIGPAAIGSLRARLRAGELCAV